MRLPRKCGIEDILMATGLTRWVLSMSLVIVGLATLALAENIPVSPDQGPVVGGVEMRTFVKPGSHFSCEVPRQWGIWIDGHYEEISKVYGVFLKGPQVQKGAPVMIGINYFAKGNTTFKSEEEYVRRNTSPHPILPPVKGEKLSPIRKITVAGREARTFDRDTFEYYPPKSLHIKEIPVMERTVVVPAQEGFYVLFYEAPTAVFDQYAPVFDLVLQSFKPGH
jgi:hypothetical protein